LFWYWTHWTLFCVSCSYIHFLYNTLLAPSCLAAYWHPRPLDVSVLFCQSVSSFLLPDCISPSLPFARACWIKHRCSLSQKICRLHQILLPSLYPITDGSSKLMQDLSWTNLTPCFFVSFLKQMRHRAGLEDTSTTNT